MCMILDSKYTSFVQSRYIKLSMYIEICLLPNHQKYLVIGFETDYILSKQDLSNILFISIYICIFLTQWLCSMESDLCQYIQTKLLKY